MNRHTSLRLVLAGGCVAVACGPRAQRLAPAAPGEIVGLYEGGFGGRGFRLCDLTGDGGVWRPVAWPARFDARRMPGTPTRMSAVVTYVRGRGALAAPVAGGTGRPWAVVIDSVTEARAARRGDCGWSPS